jgi:hypothetical protein
VRRRGRGRWGWLAVTFRPEAQCSWGIIKSYWCMADRQMDAWEAACNIPRVDTNGHLWAVPGTKGAGRWRTNHTRTS